MSTTKAKANTNKSRFRTAEMAYIALFAVIIAVCSWISVPVTVPYTLQTFGIFTSLLILGGKRGTISVLLYILLGATGLPVFSGFLGGIGVLLGARGGYIIGFLIMAIIYWITEQIFGHRLIPLVLSMLIGLFALYTIGTLWFVYVYANTNAASDIGYLTALKLCVLPFIIPDLLKMFFAFLIARRLKILVNL
ncbi:MAG: biotin transporter BioY [Eubacteriales bacterium]|jgi:biotin transport system substrate-specific component